MTNSQVSSLKSQPVLKAVLVDDEELARDELGYLLNQVGGVEVIGEAGNGVEALTTIDKLQPDVVFLDVQMPGLTGFEVARRMLGTRAASQIIFVTAYDQHAIEAFEVNGALVNGNWVSGDIIKNQTSNFNQYSADLSRWSGSLQGVNNTSLFMLKTDNHDTNVT